MLAFRLGQKSSIVCSIIVRFTPCLAGSTASAVFYLLVFFSDFFKILFGSCILRGTINYLLCKLNIYNMVRGTVRNITKIPLISPNFSYLS